MKNSSIKSVLKWLSHYFVFFLLVAFVITCCTMLFVSTLRDSLGITLTDANISAAAKITFLNVALLSLIFTVVDTLRRQLTVSRPVKHITDAAEKIIQGDFSVRVEPQSKLGTDETFNRVIECFNKMAEELGSVETLRTDFIANVSHELKTPLAVIQNYGTMLEKKDLPEDKRIEYAKTITTSSRRLADLISNILKLNKLENQQIMLSPKIYDLGEQLCECLLSFEDVWEKKGLEIETDIEDGVLIKSDYEMMSIVWNNLFSNAVKFTEKGGRVSLSLKTKADTAVVKIADTGCGISNEVGKNMFDKFYQGDTSHFSEGNGLGLALVKRIVDITKSDISVESEVGIGTVFTVRIRRETGGEL